MKKQENRHRLKECARDDGERFFMKVYALVAQIPKGKVTTYGQLAAMLGYPCSARVIGWAMRCAPARLHLPCHRVVYKSGELPPPQAFGDPSIQKEMLEKEHITFQVDGRIDMHKHLWIRARIRRIKGL